MYRWIPLNPNMDNPNSWLFWSPMEITHVDLQISYVLICPLNPKFAKFEGFSLGIPFFRMKREAPVRAPWASCSWSAREAVKDVPPSCLDNTEWDWSEMEKSIGAVACFCMHKMRKTIQRIPCFFHKKEKMHHCWATMWTQAKKQMTPCINLILICSSDT